MLEWVALALIVAVAAPLILLLYLVWLKPKMELPLENEEDEGTWKIPLSRLGLLSVGKVTTARNYVQSLWSKTLTSTVDQTERTRLEELRDSMLRMYLFAQKVERKKILLIFDQNPLDSRFHMREDKSGHLGRAEKILFISSIQDCAELGMTQDGEFGCIYISLGREPRKLSALEMELAGKLGEGLRFLKLAAAGKEYTKKLEDRIKILDTLLEQALSRLNFVISQKGESDIIAGTTPLTALNVPQPSGMRFPSAKQFFTWPQIALAGLAYLITPNVMLALRIEYPDSGTVALAVAFAVYVLSPFVRKAVGR